MNIRKALFVHDHIFKIDQKGYYYSEGKITDSVFERFEPCCSEIHVLSRCQSIKNTINNNLISKDNVFFHPIKGLSFTGAFTKNIISNSFKIYSLVKFSDFLIIRMPSFLGIFSLFFAKILRRPYFIELVGDPKESISTITLKKYFGAVDLLAIIFSKIIKLAVFSAPGVIYVTKTSLQKNYPTKGFTASASNVELDIQKPDLTYERYNFPKEVVRIGLIASFKNNYKGLDTAIFAINLLKKKSLYCDLIILGSGNEVFYMNLASRLGVEGQIKFDGTRKGGCDVYNWLDEIDIYIQPSRAEGLPRSLIEAMSRGLPCIGSNAGGIPELLPERFVVAKESSLDLAAKIEFFLSDQTLRCDAGNENYLVAMDYSREKLQTVRLNFWSKVDHFMTRYLEK